MKMKNPSRIPSQTPKGESGVDSAVRKHPERESITAIRLRSVREVLGIFGSPVDGFRIQGARFRIQDSGIQGSGFGIQVGAKSDPIELAPSLRSDEHGEFRGADIQDSGFRIQDSGYRIQDSGFGLGIQSSDRSGQSFCGTLRGSVHSFAEHFGAQPPP
jgi:hypothetical protein